MKKLLTILTIMVSVIAGCSTMTTTEKEQKRSELDVMAQTAITDLIQQSPEIQEKLDKSLAYAVADMKITKIPVVGAGGGEGVLVDKNSQQRIYFTVSRFDLGGGWGVRAYKALLLVVPAQKGHRVI